MCTQENLWGTLLSQLRKKFKGHLAEYKVPVSNKLISIDKLRGEVMRLLGILSQDAVRSGERIYICIDGIDHAARANTDVSFLDSLPTPEELPEGVCFIIVGQPITLYQEQYPLWLSTRTDIEKADMPIKERIALYEKIREGTKDAYTKNCAEGWLCRIYINQGQRDKAMQIAESVPNFMFSHNDFELMLAQGKEKIYNMHYKIEENFASLCDDICFITMIEVDGKTFFTHEQAISMLEKIPRLYEVFYENEDYLGDGVMVSLAYTRMAEHYAELKDANNAIRCFVSALENAKKVDAYYEGLDNGFYGITDIWDYPQIPQEKRHTSILANPDFDYPTCTVCVDKDGESQVQRCIKDFSHSRFDFIKNEIEKSIT
ncbi:MAG: hypothetical protein IJY39_13900 [Clostridia bacterium]|nr:hypothetical protein [Clostridia bacterium]